MTEDPPELPDEVRDELAVQLAEKWWPGKYAGDVTGPEWDKVYAAIDDGERP
jgi:hypothetical protein